ncbi:hypothetical protein V2G26_018420 [Clonostachys chloroleuca]
MSTLKLYHDKLGGALYPAPHRACDQCRRRRLKCDRGKPCMCCKKSVVECSYSSAPKPRGRRPRLRPQEAASPASSKTPETTSDVIPPVQEHVFPGRRSEIAQSQQLEHIDESSANGWAGVELEEPSIGWQSLPSILSAETEWSRSLEWLQTSSCEETSPSNGSLADSQPHGHIEALIANDTATSEQSPPSEPCGWVTSDTAFVIPPCFSPFLPYIEIFFERLYPVFPVLDKECVMKFLQSEDSEEPLPTGFHPFLFALSAAVIVQLNTSDIEASQPSLIGSLPNVAYAPPQTPLAQFFVSQCLQMRQTQDFIEKANEWTVLTSFFLFSYYGNLDQSRSAWYYLREAIGFAQALGLDKAECYGGMDSRTAQQRRRLFWLLFISERAYSLQQRRKSVLRPSIDLPRVFESECPKLIFGFVALAKVFSTVDEEFIDAWVDQAGTDHSNGPPGASRHMSKFLDPSCTAGTVSPSEIDEIQRLDISVTQQWLRVLTCQLNIRRSLRHSSSTDSRTTYASYSQYVAESARNLLHTITAASPKCLEAHGIGMEQKVSDVATCLCDVLMSFMVFLAGFRNHESQYLEPLARRASMALVPRIHPRPFPKAASGAASNPRLAEMEMEMQGSQYDQEKESASITGGYLFDSFPPLGTDLWSSNQGENPSAAQL